MEIRGVNEAGIKTAAAEVGVALARWRATRQGFAFVLRPLEIDGKYAVRSRWGRRVHAVCYHGHYDFMKKIFDLSPSAIILSVMAKYHGVKEFERKAKNLDPRRGFEATWGCAH